MLSTDKLYSVSYILSRMIIRYTSMPIVLTITNEKLKRRELLIIS